MKIKKILSLMLVCTMVFVMASCGSKVDEGSEGTANPVHECTMEEMTDATGITIDAPEGASDVAYAYIEGDAPIAEVTFTLDGQEYCYRAQSSDMTGFGLTDPDADPFEAFDNACNAGQELSGLHYTFEDQVSGDIDGREMILAVNAGNAGFAAWIDVVPGILYCLGTESNADMQNLADVADAVFEPMQGEAQTNTINTIIN